MMEYGNFRFNLGPGEDKKYHKITAVGMRNVTAGFGKYNLEEIGQEFRVTYISESDISDSVNLEAQRELSPRESSEIISCGNVFVQNCSNNLHSQCCLISGS